MRCPKCGASNARVIDSRPNKDGYRIRRRYECRICQKRFSTFETPTDTYMKLQELDDKLYDIRKILDKGDLNGKSKNRY